MKKGMGDFEEAWNWNNETSKKLGLGRMRVRVRKMSNIWKMKMNKTLYRSIQILQNEWLFRNVPDSISGKKFSNYP